jgi:hypothetical protein
MTTATLTKPLQDTVPPAVAARGKQVAKHRLVGTREHSALRIAMDMGKWLQQFLETKGNFDGTRGCLSAVVRITFRDGLMVIARQIQAGPGDGFIPIFHIPMILLRT